MKVGDLVTYAFQGERTDRNICLIIEAGKYTGNADVIVKWGWHHEPVTQKSAHLKVISEGR